MWTEKSRTSPHLQAVSDSENYSTLTSYLSGDLNLDATISKIQQPLVQALEKSRSDGNSSNQVFELPEDLSNDSLRQLWDSVLLIASKTPHASPRHAKLVDLLSTLAEQAPLGIVEKDSQGQLWSDLPLFGQETRKYFNYPLPEQEEGVVDEESRDGWINMNSFLARLTNAYKTSSSEDGQSVEALDTSLNGLWALRTAIENDQPKDSITAAAWTGTAAVWVIYAKSALKAFSIDNKEFRGNMGAAGTKLGGREKGWKGYCEERWQFWQQELPKLEKATADKVARDLVHEAVETMNA